MKRLFLLFISIATLVSCDINGDDAPNFSLEILPIQSVNTPSQFVVGEAHPISVTYIRPSGCYEFNNFIFDNNLNTRTVAVVDTFFQDDPCSLSTEVATVSFDFTVRNTDVHIFQFFQGQDEQGQDQFLIVEVPVVE
ncbi:hypothetical protein [Winogradskyella immobilis]|uniref:Lipoprotein n=1 Tax=Winogradskyella immobilis TaxID=2816852 RepID=A0ABS8EQN3_9FLAO|nr:hypothetical protein [Winogradskyella immobilis]MCC1485521.1 hypothetical protein [Winogradskyella immobilis]MCG0017613.1 hypothetical protein [Winogradskyella immobilis]